MSIKKNMSMKDKMGAAYRKGAADRKKSTKKIRSDLHNKIVLDEGLADNSERLSKKKTKSKNPVDKLMNVSQRHREKKDTRTIRDAVSKNKKQQKKIDHYVKTGSVESKKATTRKPSDWYKMATGRK